MVSRTVDESERFSFEAFTRHPFFTEVNRWIVERVICPGRRKIVDLGCGPGAVTKLILERLDDGRNAGTAVPRQFLTADEYSDLCVRAAFSRPSVELVRIEMTPESIEDIGRFSLFIEGALPGVPLEEGSKALQEGLRRAMDETGFHSVPRNW